MTTRDKICKDGKTLEQNVFAYCSSRKNKAIIVDLKNHVRERQSKQFSPSHADNGILAALDSPDDLKESVLRDGFTTW